MSNSSQDVIDFLLKIPKRLEVGKFLQIYHFGISKIHNLITRIVFCFFKTCCLKGVGCD